jgi:hypothetical protein
VDTFSPVYDVVSNSVPVDLVVQTYWHRDAQAAASIAVFRLGSWGKITAQCCAVRGVTRSAALAAPSVAAPGLQRPILEWSMRQGWGGRAVRIEQAQGILVAALGVLASHYGYGRR